MKLEGFFLILIIVPVLLLFFGHALFSFFSQDDFFHLRVVMDKSFENIPPFFLSLQEGYAFYRPLSREAFNLVMFKIFGLNPLPFHSFNFILIVANTILGYTLIYEISKKKVIAFLTTLIYTSSVIHSVELYYLASVQTLFATFFLLLSILFYFRASIKIGVRREYIFSIIFFVLALFSHETAIVLPGVLLFLEFFLLGQGRLKKMNSLYFLPFAAITLFYLINTSLLSNLPQQQVYRPVFSPKSIINTLSWYTLWNFGLSEMLIDFVGPKFTINPNLMKWYGTYLKVVIPLFVFLVLSVVIFVIRTKKLNFKILIFYIFSYITALSPFLFFPQHKSSYYLNFSAIWFSAILGIVFYAELGGNKIMKIWAVLLVIVFMTISYQTSQLNKLTYWAAKRGNAAYNLLSDFKKLNPSLSKESVIFLKNDPNYPYIAKEWGSSSKQAFYILSGADAFKLIYKNPNLKVYFEDMGGLPDNVNKSWVISYIAQFPY